MMTRPADPASARQTAEARDRDDGSLRVVESTTLFAGRPQLAILHNRPIYFLRETRLGKLILTR
jgi:hemin uptake protein HemP